MSTICIRNTQLSKYTSERQNSLSEEFELGIHNRGDIRTYKSEGCTSIESKFPCKNKERERKRERERERVATLVVGHSEQESVEMCPPVGTKPTTVYDNTV